jgi:hypothetical protein
MARSGDTSQEVNNITRGKGATSPPEGVIGDDARAGGPKLAAADMSVFDNLDALRIIDPASLSGDIEHLTHIYVRRPKKDEYFRTCPDPEMTLTTMIWTDPDEGDVYLVLPAARDLMAESGKVVSLVLCQSRQRVNFIWPVSADTRSGGGRGWAESARSAVLLARTRWIKIRGDRPSGMYQVLEAAEQSGEPEWPKLSFNELLKLGFKGCLITPDHPVVRRVQGYI